jgi:anti-sigma factor RsiW
MSTNDGAVLAAHPAALLLPAFANGTLSGEERRHVAEHIAVCAQCRGELEECQRLGAELREVYAGEAAPSPAVWRTVQERVARERAGIPWTARLDNALRALLRPSYAPTFALLLLVAQFGVLAWMFGSTEGNVTGEVTTRSLAPAGMRVRVALQPQASAADVASLLRQLRGRIVDGPDANGFYIVELPADARYAELSARHPGLIKSAAPLAPR